MPCLVCVHCCEAFDLLQQRIVTLAFPVRAACLVFDGLLFHILHSKSSPSSARPPCTFLLLVRSHFQGCFRCPPLILSTNVLSFQAFKSNQVSPVSLLSPPHGVLQIRLAAPLATSACQPVLFHVDLAVLRCHRFKRWLIGKPSCSLLTWLGQQYLCPLNILGRNSSDTKLPAACGIPEYNQ